MARAVARIATFQWRDGGFDAWLYGILRHVVIDAQRANAREFRRRVPAEATAASPLDFVLEGEEAEAVTTPSRNWFPQIRRSSTFELSRD